MSNKLKETYQSSHLYGSNAPYIESFYEDWLEDKASVPQHWADAFSRMLNGGGAETGHLDIQEKFRILGQMPSTSLDDTHLADRKEAAVLKLITTYRLRGHQKANLNPLGIAASGRRGRTGS